LTAVAHADPAWMAGVSAEQQARANALFEEGNVLFAKQAHRPALAKYEQAIALWDHPLIRFNMAVTKLRLDLILEAYDDLERALRYDSAPFPAALYAQALDYRKLLAGRVARVTARCTQTGTRVTLDGKPWFTCPADERRRVLTGDHLLVAERPGYATLTRHLFLTAGSDTSERVDLERAGARHTSWYQRWYVIPAAGLVAAGLTGGIIYATRTDADQSVPFQGSVGGMAW
jgi:tetratricopeptide (TPR) repeat protein